MPPGGTQCRHVAPGVPCGDGGAGGGAGGRAGAGGGGGGCDGGCDGGGSHASEGARSQSRA